MKPMLWTEDFAEREEHQALAPTPDHHAWVDLSEHIDWTSAKNSAKSYEWYLQYELGGLAMLRKCVEVDPLRVRGVPVLRGTRFTVAQVLAELADTSGPDEVADSFELDSSLIREVIEGLSLMLNKPFV